MLNVADFKTYSWATNDTLATSALRKAEGFVATILGDIESSEKTETYDWNGEYILILKRTPVVSVAELKFSGDLVDTSEYFPNEYGIRMYTQFPRGFGVISVKYTAWWTVDTIPKILKYAIYDLAWAYYLAWDTLGASNVKRESVDGASIEWGDLQISEPLKVINSYKTIHV